MAHRDEAPRSNLGFSPHRPWGLPTTTSAGQQGPAAGASHLEFTQGRLRKKATSSANQVDGRTYTFALQSGFTRLPRFTSNLDCQSETKAYSSDQFRSCRGERPLWLQDWIRASGAKHGNSFCTALIHRSRFGPAEAALRSEAAQRSEDGHNHVRRGQRRIGLAFKTGIQDFSPLEPKWLQERRQGQATAVK